MLPLLRPLAGNDLQYRPRHDCMYMFLMLAMIVAIATDVVLSAFRANSYANKQLVGWYVGHFPVHFLHPV